MALHQVVGHQRRAIGTHRRSAAKATQGIPVQNQQHGGQRHPPGLAQQRQPQEHDRRGIPAPSSACAGRIPEVGQQAGQQEEDRQHVPPLGHPGDGFHAQGVDGKKQRRQRGRPSGRGIGLPTRARQRQGEQTPREQVEQAGVQRVQNEVRQVKAKRAFRAEPPQFVVDGKAEPGQGVVMADPIGAGHPLELRSAQAAEVIVLQEYLAIVPGEKLVVQGRQEDQKCDRHDPERQEDAEPGGSADDLSCGGMVCRRGAASPRVQSLCGDRSAAFRTSGVALHAGPGHATTLASVGFRQ
jgi:hypothetical protein